MEMTGQREIAAPRDQVWRALNDPAVLAQCIPGCRSLVADGDNRYVAEAEVRIGPIGARFKGDIALSEIDAPTSYVIEGAGNGGIAGSARGSAKVSLSDSGQGTLVDYAVRADVGGRMAQLGGPIIDATARNMADRFFARFAEVVGETSLAASEPGEAPTAAAVSAPAAVAAPRRSTGLVDVGAWLATLVAALVAGYLLGLSNNDSTALLGAGLLLIAVGAVGFAAGKRSNER